MLGKLDDQMDDRDYTHIANLPPQLAGEPIRGRTADEILSPPPVLPPSYLTFNQTVGSRPNLPSDFPQRVPLSKCVGELVNQWSMAFLDLAKDNDTSAMCLVAQMYLFHRGYGLIKPNHEEGIKWILKAVDLNDVEAREAARRMCPDELAKHLSRKGANNSALLAEERAANHNFK